MKQNTEIDEVIAHNIKQMRVARGFTQQDVATVLGVTFQQVGKYEKLTSRIPSSKLFLLADLCGVDVNDIRDKSTTGKERLGKAQLSIMKDVSEIKDPCKLNHIKKTSKMMLECEKIENGQT